LSQRVGNVSNFSPAPLISPRRFRHARCRSLRGPLRSPPSPPVRSAAHVALTALRAAGLAARLSERAILRAARSARGRRRAALFRLVNARADELLFPPPPPPPAPPAPPPRAKAAPAKSGGLFGYLTGADAAAAAAAAAADAAAAEARSRVEAARREAAVRTRREWRGGAMQRREALRMVVTTLSI
jgi:hypothetical protein